MRCATRRDDEVLLSWLSARAQGVSVAVIAVGAATTQQRVSVATNRVLREYLRTLPPKVRSSVQARHFWKPVQRAGTIA